MAKFSPGPLAGAVSGSQGGITFSHNKGGPYFRSRAIPTNPATSFQVNQRARVATTAGEWQGLTAAQRLAWTEWARQNPVVNALGHSILLSGEQAYIQLNTRLLQDGGVTAATPPIVPANPGFTTMTQSGDIGLGTVALTFAPALPADMKVWLRAAVLNSAGITYVKNRLRFVATSAIVQASPWDNEAEIVARLGTLTVGQTLHVEAGVFNPTNGLLSTMLRASVVITTT